jgi:hypothetical protein
LHLSSEVEGEVRTNYGNKHEVEGDDEREDNDGNVHNEAPHPTRTSSFNILMDWIVLPSVDQIVFIQLQMEY